MSVKPVLRLAVVAAIAVTLPACSESAAKETARQALERLAPSRAGATLTAVAPPASYRIDFDRIDATSTRNGDGRFEPQRVERTVRRPFVSMVKGEIQRRLGFEQDTPRNVERAVYLRPLPDEPRPDVFVPSAARDANRNRTAAGRTCRVFLYANAEYCVDASGLVLASRIGNTVEVARKVTLLGDAPSAPDIAATLAEGVSDPTRGSVRPMEPTSSPPGRNDWSLPSAPAGFSFVGRYSAVPLSGEVLQAGSQEIVAGIVDVYVRGIDTIVVDRGGKLSTDKVTDKNLGTLAESAPVELGALGTGVKGIGGIGPFGYREVRAFPEKGRYVVVAGTVPMDELIEVARALRPSPGNTLRYLDKL